MLQVFGNLFVCGDAAIDQDLQRREILLELVGVFVFQRRNLAVFLGRETFQDRVARVHDKGGTAGLVNPADEIAHEFIVLDLVDTDAVFHRHIDIDGIAHGLNAIGHQIGLQHQAGAETAVLHALGGAAEQSGLTSS